ncbi:hypothetical protein ACFL6B_03420 [Thermodesulfobacteriota bacterium]
MNPSEEQAKEKTQKVLFIGNSVFNTQGSSLVPFEGFCMTARLNYDALSHFEFFGRSREGRVDPFMRNQATDERIIKLLGSHQFDYVVLVTRYSDLLDEKKTLQTIEAFKQMHARIVRSGAKTVISMAYTPTTAFQTISKVANGHRRIKAEIDGMIFNGITHPAILVPTGLLWIDGKEYFGKNAWYADKMHGTQLAQYATGCLFYTFITREDPRENPFVDLPHPRKKKGLEIKKINSQHAKWIKDRAWSYFQNF